jgi:hypothetical protein
MKLFYFYFILFCTVVKAQEKSIYTRTLDIENGAPAEQFYDIAQHPNQSILLASDKGIFTFNGIRFNELPSSIFSLFGRFEKIYLPEKKGCNSQQSELPCYPLFFDLHHSKLVSNFHPNWLLSVLKMGFFCPSCTK